MAEAAEKIEPVRTTVVSITNPMAHDHILDDADFKKVIIKSGATVDGVTLRDTDILYHRKAFAAEKKRGGSYIEISTSPPPAVKK